MKKITGIERLQNLRNENSESGKKKPKKIDLIVKGVCIYWIAFVSIAWITFWVKGAVPDTLVQYGLGGGAVELLVTGAIEITRDLFIQKKEDIEDERADL